MYRFKSECNGKVLTSVDVIIGDGDSFELGVNCSPQEAFTLMTLPSFAGLVVSMVPNYELSEMPKE